MEMLALERVRGGLAARKSGPGWAWQPLKDFKNLDLKMAILVLKTAPNHQNLDQNSDQNGPSPNFCLKNVNSQDSGQPLSETFDGLSLTGAEIFAFKFTFCIQKF